MDNKIEIKEKPKKFGIGFYFILFGLIFFLIGYFCGICQIQKDKDIKISVDYEEQTFRTSKGYKIYPIRYKGQLYVPYNGLGSFLNYMTIENQETGDINLITLEEDVDLKPLKDMKTEDYNGENIDSSVFNNSEYTALFIIATWCPDCKNLLGDLKDNSQYFEKNGIQILTLVVDVPNLENKNQMTKEIKDKVYKLTDGIGVKHYLYADSVLSSKIVGNSIAIPKMVIYDKEGYQVKVINDMSFNTLKNTFDGIFGRIK